MPLSVPRGLACFTVLLFVLAPVRPQCYTAFPRTPFHFSLTCCSEVSNATFGEPFTSCFEQKDMALTHCRVHAFIFTTEDERMWCVDPRASWLPVRFKKLEAKGICCQTM